MKGGEVIIPFQAGQHYLITFKDPNKDPINVTFQETQYRTLVFSHYENGRFENIIIAADEQGRSIDENVEKIERINIRMDKAYEFKFKGDKPNRISKVIGMHNQDYTLIDIGGEYTIKDNFTELEGMPQLKTEPVYRIRYKPHDEDLEVKILKQGPKYIYYQDINEEKYLVKKFDKTDPKPDLQYEPIDLGNGNYKIKLQPRQPKDHTVTVKSMAERNGINFIIFEDRDYHEYWVRSDFSNLANDPVQVGGKRRTRRKRALTKKRSRK